MSRVAAALGAFALAGAVVGQSPPPPAPPPALRGTMQSAAFPLGGRWVGFVVYLPEGYFQGDQRYPVVYHLHGLGNSPWDAANVAVPQAFESAREAGLIGPVIIVFPNGFGNSWWSDSAEGFKPAESDVIQQLIPYVDTHYQTLATRESRVIEGFSMGGFGAIKFFAKYPEKFVCCVGFDAAVWTWPEMQAVHPGDAQYVFGGSEERYNEYSPWYWTQQNAGMLAEGSPIRLVVATLVYQNRGFRDYLGGLQVPWRYLEAGCDHNQTVMMNAQGVAAAAFIGTWLQTDPAGCAADADGDGRVTPADVGAFVSNWFSSLQGGTLDGDFDRNERVEPADIAAFVAAWFRALAVGC